MSEKSKLIDIAKECEANLYADCNVTLRGENVCLSPEQLRATVEQVARPLVEALNIALDIASCDADLANSADKISYALATYTEIMGEKK